MSTGAAGSVALPAIYQNGRDESVRVILGNAAKQVEIAADAFNLHGFIKPKAYAAHFSKAAVVWFRALPHRPCSSPASARCARAATLL